MKSDDDDDNNSNNDTGNKAVKDKIATSSKDIIRYFQQFYQELYYS